MTGVSPGNVKILNVTSSSRRRLSFSLEGTASGISTLYVVAVASQYSVSDLQSQLVTSTSNGFFNEQLTANAEKFGAAGFVNATSTGIIILTVAPTAAPFNPPSPSNNNGKQLSAGAIAGITIMSVVVVFAILAAVYYYYYYDKAIMLPSSSSLSFKALPKMPSLSLRRFWSRRENFDPFSRGTRESQDTTPVSFNNPISSSRNTRSNRASEFTVPSLGEPGERPELPIVDERGRDRESASSTQSRSFWSIFPSSFSLRQSWSRPQSQSEDRRSSFGNKDRPMVFDNPIAANKRGTTINPLRSPQSKEGASEAEIRDKEREREKDKLEFVNPSFVNHPRMKKTKKEDIDIFL